MYSSVARLRTEVREQIEKHGFDRQSGIFILRRIRRDRDENRLLDGLFDS